MVEGQQLLGFRSGGKAAFAPGVATFGGSQGELHPWRQQSSSHEVQVGQREQRLDARCVLEQAAERSGRLSADLI
jgi:hypothetical protein